MTVQLPEWQPFPADESPWIPELDDRGRVVVALAPAPSAREQWSAKIVLDLLDSWSESGHRVVLADCVLEHPTLHRSAGLPNDEGLVDAALFGASVSRVARPVPGRGFFFVGAGSPTGDAEAVLSSARLGRLQKGFRDAGVTFVAFIRQGCVGETALIDDADDVLVLARTADQIPGRARNAAGKVRAVVGPGDVTSSDAVPPVSGGTDVDLDGGEISESAGAPGDLPETGASLSAGDEDPVPAEPPEHPGPADEDDLWEAPLRTGPVEGTDASEASEQPFPADDLEASEPTLQAVPAEDPVEAGVPEPDGPPAGVPTSEPESWMDFSAQEDADGEEAGAPAPGTGAYPREADPVSPPPRARRARSGADPDARKKLLWVALAVLVLVVLVVLGALG